MNSTRHWSIKWQLPDDLDLATLRAVVGDVRGFGHVLVEHDNGFPLALKAGFRTDDEFDEFDLHDALLEVENTIGSERLFPTRPTPTEEVT